MEETNESTEGVVYRLKRIGPRMEHCGTSQVRGSKGER